MNVLILEDEQRNFNRLRCQLEEIDTTFHVEGPLANIQESVAFRAESFSVETHCL